MNRYQNQNIFEKLKRRIKYQIPCVAKEFIRLPLILYNYYIKGENKEFRLSFILGIIFNEWTWKAKWYYTMDDLAERCKRGEE